MANSFSAILTTTNLIHHTLLLINVYCRLISGVVYHLQYSFCHGTSCLGGDKIKKFTIVSSTYKLNKARIKCQDLEKLTCTSSNALCGEEDERFDLVLANFGVNVEAILNSPTVPIRLFHCWIETWEEPLLKTNNVTSKIRLLQKYKGLVFKDDDDTTYPPCITYTI